MAALHLAIVTQEEELFSAEVTQVSLPAANGEITVLPGHEAYMSTLLAGEITVWANDGVKRMIVSPGFVQIAEDKVSVLVDSAIREEALSEQAAEEARKAAEQAMAEAKTATEIAVTLGTIERTLMEMQAIRKGRGRHSAR